MDAETSQGGTVPSAEVPGPEWLIDIINKEQERLTKKTRNQADEQRTRPMTLIQKAEENLRKSNETCFEPKVVSLGPFHHGKESLKDMESHKKVSAVWFIALATSKPANEVTVIESNVYQQFIEKVKLSPRDLYADHESISDSVDLMPMMFLDGCFILYFIHLIVNRSDDLSNGSHRLNQKLIVRDMFLLENQIPYPILSALMSLLPNQEIKESSITKFIFTVFLPSYEMNFSWSGCVRVTWIFNLFLPRLWRLIFHPKEAGKEPLHLLHVLREVLLGVRDSHDPACRSVGFLHVLREVLLGVRDSRDCAGGSAGYLNYYFRPITELTAAGIQVRRSRGMTLKHLKFKRGLLNSYLEIPQIIVDDSTKDHLLNLVAYEKCPNGPKDRTVTSYVCLLRSLIDRAKDVNELRKENILFNRLGSGVAVSKLFKELATTNLSPDSNAFAHVINGISDHYKRNLSHERMRIGEWIHQFKRTYFRSPWSFISSIAAVSVIALTLLQTIYTIWAFYKTN